MTGAWSVDARCLYCGTDLLRVNGCRPSTSLVVSVVSCPACSREFDLTVRLTERRRTTRVQRRLKVVS